MPRRAHSEEQLDAAIEALADRERFREAEELVAAAAPKLQRVLAEALAEGGWFGESHEAEVLKAATKPDAEERLTAVRTLLAEETRMGMMVGVAIGWALAEQLSAGGEPAPGGGAPSGDEKRRPASEEEG